MPFNWMVFLTAIAFCMPQDTLQNRAGPYTKVIYKRAAHMCERSQQRDMIDFHVDMRRVKEGIEYFGYFYTKQDIDNATVYGKVYTETSTGDYKLFYKETFKNACNTGQFLCPELMKKFLLSLGLENKCPLPAGNYTFSGFTDSGVHFAKFPILPYGDFLVEIALEQDKQFLGCGDFYVEVLPVSFG